MTNEGYTETQWKFKDGKRTIDYVLVHDDSSHWASSSRFVNNRKTFEANLKEEGLELEYETVEGAGLVFIKIHAPLNILQRYAEILKFRQPLKKVHETRIEGPGLEKRSIFSCCADLLSWCSPFEVNEDIFPECKQELTENYSRARNYLFDDGRPVFFKPAQKARIVQFILERTLYSNDQNADVFDFGINRLLLNGVYTAAYPLHDGDVDTPGSMRYNFYHYWASFKNWYKKQPGNYIRLYFGPRTALYFLWLGYYTYMLILAAFFGVACFIVSFLFLPLSYAIGDVCSGEFKDVLCPVCDRHCKFVSVSSLCVKTTITYFFDNVTTAVFAIFMTFWAAIFMECWKRYSAETTFLWDLTSIDNRDENPRAEYAAKLSKLVADKKISHKLNFITMAKEPQLSYWRYLFLGQVISIATMFLLISLAVAGVIGVILYRTLTLAILPIGMLSSISASVLNLACIFMFSPIYGKLAKRLTEMELPRTQPEYERSLTIKMYLLEFINHYASIFYIAFIKGKFVGLPSHYNRIFGYRQLECGPGTGCMFELTQQLAVIMIGKRALRSFLKIFKPAVTKQVRRRYSKLYAIRAGEEMWQWEKDFLLTEGGPRLLLPEYIDMILQYGFVTIFVAAFPLAPVFALINNIFEIRVDAQKFVLYYRRPTMRRIKDIGVWFDVLNFVSCLAIFTNGFIISFTSDFIPRVVYRLIVSKDYHTEGFMNHSLSYMAIQDLDMKHMPNTTAEYCRYLDYREPPWSKNKYEETEMYWIVLASRLTFFIVFENVIILAVVLVKWFIADVPQRVQWQMRRRHYQINEIIISNETSQKTLE